MTYEGTKENRILYKIGKIDTVYKIELALLLLEKDVSFALLHFQLLSFIICCVCVGV